MISGAIQNTLPRRDFMASVRDASRYALEAPKSASFTIPSRVTNTLAPLTSLWGREGAQRAQGGRAGGRGVRAGRELHRTAARDSNVWWWGGGGVDARVGASGGGLREGN
jgi:hypothetical protein